MQDSIMAIQRSGRKAHDERELVRGEHPATQEARQEDRWSPGGQDQTRQRSEAHSKNKQKRQNEAARKPGVTEVHRRNYF